jgi:hypothetical protein
MSREQTFPCWDCGTTTRIVRVAKRHNDGRVRCAAHRREHRDRIKASWMAAAMRYDPHQNRGGMNLVDVA